MTTHVIDASKRVEVLFSAPSIKTMPAATHLPADVAHTPASSQVHIKQPSRRPLCPLPAPLLDHCGVCFEEGLWSQALSLLSNSLTSGLSTNAPAAIPPPNYLAFAATLAVHPLLTTRTIEQERHVAADQALTYLRHAVNNVDAAEGGLRDAFSFRDSVSRSSRDRSRRSRSRKSDASGGSDNGEEKTGLIRSPYAEEKSLWNNAEDFWAVVGWAFNCSVRHRPRWERWKPWLALILDVLQSDLEATAASGGPMKETLIAKYISSVGEGRNSRRRIMRAITADGTDKSMSLFDEIWRNETKPPKTELNQRPHKRQKLDLDNGQYGDYYDSASDGESMASRRRRSLSASAVPSRPTRTDAASEAGSQSEGDADNLAAAKASEELSATGLESFGGEESIRLRQRFLSLLTRLSRVAPTLFMDTEEFFDIFTEFLRPLPLAIFQQFVLPSKPYLSSDNQASLNEMLSRPLLGSNSGSEEISREEFETRFAPQCARNTTSIDNAKVSLIVESLLRALWSSGWLHDDLVPLRIQIDKGIQARKDKVAYDGRKKADKNVSNEEYARAVLECSARRMQVLVDTISA